MANTAPATWSIPTANGHAHTDLDELFPPPRLRTELETIPLQYLPGGRKSLSGISVRAFCLGITFGVCLLSAAQLAYFEYGLWRVPFFVATLATFHYLEFDMTARFNPPDGKVASFLLFNNGSEYVMAHTLAIVETLSSFWLRSRYKPDWLNMPFRTDLTGPFPTTPPTFVVSLGLTLVVVGQTMRSLAMAHAKTNFNHVVQSMRKQDHVLVTDGVYAFSRHPSYFGFFWWGLGTQMVLGNHVCFLVYLVLLWGFFNRRINHEEKHLVQFFGEDYVEYRKRVRVWIPFIR